MEYGFSARIDKVGINPCVAIPLEVSRGLGRRGYVPVRGTLNGSPIRSTLVPVGGGRHRLYINTEMRRQAGVSVGDEIQITLRVDPQPRALPLAGPLRKALDENPTAREKFERLPPSHRREILAYLNWLKTPQALERNARKVVSQLLEERGPSPLDEERMQERIVTLHPGGKKGVNISRAKYEMVKQSILGILGEQGEMTFYQLHDAVAEKLAGQFEGSVGWYYTTVKLDLEARKAIERVPGSRPQRIRLVRP